MSNLSQGWNLTRGRERGGRGRGEGGYRHRYTTQRGLSSLHTGTGTIEHRERDIGCVGVRGGKVLIGGEGGRGQLRWREEGR